MALTRCAVACAFFPHYAITQLGTQRLKTFHATQRYSHQGLSGIPSALQVQASIGTATFEFDASGARWKQDLLRTYVGGGTARLTTLPLCLTPLRCSIWGRSHDLPIL